MTTETDNFIRERPRFLTGAMFLQQHHGAVGLPGIELERGGESSASSPVRHRSSACFGQGLDGGGTGDGSPRVSDFPAFPGNPTALPVPHSHLGAGVIGVDARDRDRNKASMSFHTATEHGVGGSHHGWNEAYRAKMGDRPKADGISLDSNVTRMDRRQAWIRFLALDACKDVCIGGLLSEGASLTDGEFSRTLMMNGCKMLKEGLGLSGLLLDECSGKGVSIHWDDVEAASGQGRIVMVDDGRRDGTFGDIMTGKIREKAQWADRDVMDEGDRSKDWHQGTTLNRLRGNGELQFGVPSVEVRVSRVVGAPFLDTICHDASIDEGPGDYSIRAYIKGGTPSTCAIGSTGGVVSGDALCISSSQITSVKDVLYLEVYKEGQVLEACGSVMISELQRLAVRSDALGQEPAPSLLRQLIHPAGFGFKKRKESGGSMVWAKLVATDGAPAGHVLLAAKARPGQFVAGAGGRCPGSAANTMSSNGGRSGNGSGSGQTPAISSSVPEGERDAVQAYMPGDMGAPLQIRALHGIPGASGDIQCFVPYGKTQLVDPNDLHLGDGGKGAQGEDTVGANALASLALNREGKHYGNISGGYLQVNARHVYDVLLDCALKGSGCDRAGSSLELQPHWSWLTKQFASKHGIREEYATLAYLQWILENHRVQPNSMCFEVIAAKHVAMKTASKASALESHELSMNTKVRQDIKSLLNKTFENYFALKQKYDDDVEFVPTRGPQAATVLRSAIKLLYLVLDGDASSASHWMSVRFKRAASKRFYAILAAIEAQIIEEETGGERGAAPSLGGAKAKAGARSKISRSTADVVAYKKVGDLCRSVVEEIREDEAIQASLTESSAALEGAMVASIPENTSMEYIQGIAAHLKAVLSRYPPRRPTPAAISLVQAVGHLQDFLERHEYMDAAVRLNSFEAFSGFIHHWISSSSASLRRGVQIIDEAPGSSPAGLKWKDLHENRGNMVVPFAEVLLRELQKEMELYRPILGIWPSYAVDVELACVDVLRLAITVASKHCGLVQYGSSTPKDSSTSKRRTAWKWTSAVDPVNASVDAQEGVTDAIRHGTNVLQALLMNTLRRLLAVMPQIESTIQLWCDSRPETSLARGEGELGNSAQVNRRPEAHPSVGRSAKLYDAGTSPELGALWAQLVKEVRTEYYATITLTAEALSRQLSTSAATSVQHSLRRSGLEASESSMVRKSERALNHTSPTLHILASALDNRVFVALSRGLWDLTARQILQYAEDLTEGSGGTKGAWRGRQNAAVVLACVENFFKHEISSCMGNDLQPKDLDPPQHFQRAKALVSKGSNRVDQSFDVY